MNAHLLIRCMLSTHCAKLWWVMEMADRSGLQVQCSSSRAVHTRSTSSVLMDFTTALHLWSFSRAFRGT